MSYKALHRLVLGCKRLVYGTRGEPYRIAGRTLRYLPGTRPVRTRYSNSSNGIVRYDALQVQLLVDSLREGDTAIDVGAHAGQYSVLMAAKCGRTGSVVAFEPDPHARQLLRQNLALNRGLSRVTIESLALSDRVGESILYSCGGNSQSSLARAGIGEEVAHRAEKVRVQLTTLDDYIARHSMHPPQWVKIDVEGAEIAILRGARELLATDANVICELHPYVWEEMGTPFDELRTIVAASGRRMRYLDQASEISDNPTYGSVLIERVS